MLTSKQRAFLRSQAQPIQPVYQVGKNGFSEESVKGIGEALAARELIKINVLKNCFDDPKKIAQIMAERTHSQVVQVIGKKIVLFRVSKKKPVIELPK